MSCLMHQIPVFTFWKCLLETLCLFSISFQEEARRLFMQAFISTHLFVKGISALNGDFFTALILQSEDILKFSNCLDMNWDAFERLSFLYYGRVNKHQLKLNLFYICKCFSIFYLITPLVFMSSKLCNSFTVFSCSFLF